MAGCVTAAADWASRRKRLRRSVSPVTSRAEHLQRDRAVQVGVARPIHDAHPALSQLALDDVVLERLSDHDFADCTSLLLVALLLGSLGGLRRVAFLLTARRRRSGRGRELRPERPLLLEPVGRDRPLLAASSATRRPGSR